MASTLTAKITLTSTDVSTDALSLVTNTTLTTINPSITGARIEVLHTGSGTEILTSAQTIHTYFYAKNLDPTNYIVCRTAAGDEWGRLAPGESMFMGVAATIGIEFLAVNATCVLEYGYWTKS